MGGLIISPIPPIPAFFSSTCLRRRCTHSLTSPTTSPTTTSGNPYESHQRELPTRKATPAEGAQYANVHQTAPLVAISSPLVVVLALVLSTLLPIDPPASVKMGLRIVPVYTLSLHLTAVLPTPFSIIFTSRGRIGPGPLSVAWLATATLAAIVWLYQEVTSAILQWNEGDLVYAALVTCALLECALLRIWGQGLFVASPSRVRMRVDGAIIEAEQKLEEGAAEKEKNEKDEREEAVRA